MSSIVCATNAGEDSRAVHMAAFRRAEADNTKVIFLHVLGGQGFDGQPPRMRKAITEELGWLLHALIRVAKERSGAASVTSEIVLRTGAPREEILAYVGEAPPVALVIGVPRVGDASIFPEQTFDGFVAELQSLGVAVELVATGAGGTN